VRRRGRGVECEVYGLIDLHVHTNMSDGVFSPSRVVEMAAAMGLSDVAVADHDTVAGVAEGRDAAARFGVGFVPAVEISTEGGGGVSASGDVSAGDVGAGVSDVFGGGGMGAGGGDAGGGSGGVELHLLGYHVDYTNPALLEFCEMCLALRVQREARILDYLRKRGVPLDLERVKSFASHETASRPHFALAMVEAGYASSVRDAFDRHLGVPDFDAVDRIKPSVRDGINVIIGAGGVPVLAHPALLGFDDERLEALVAELVGFGLAGLECYYASYSAAQTARCLDLAVKFGLLATCGSDFHGESVKPGVRIGDGASGLGSDLERGIIEGLERWRGPGR